jgi:hypothetical protein
VSQEFPECGRACHLHDHAPRARVARQWDATGFETGCGRVCHRSLSNASPHGPSCRPVESGGVPPRLMAAWHSGEHSVGRSAVAALTAPAAGRQGPPRTSGRWRDGLSSASGSSGAGGNRVPRVSGSATTRLMGWWPEGLAKSMPQAMPRAMPRGRRQPALTAPASGPLGRRRLG